jgi:hypothetical protein
VTVKRLNYFNHQFLAEQDFKDEQVYHVDMRRRQNRFLHTWGVADGLEVEGVGDKEVLITRGFAIDKDGREIVLEDPARRDVRHLGSNTNGYVVLSYREAFEETDHHGGAGLDAYTRVTESAELRVERQLPAEDGSVVLLAQMTTDSEGRIAKLDTSVRKKAGAVLADASVAEEKLAPRLKSALRGQGWLRLPFKPSRLFPVRVAGRLVRPSEREAEASEFIIDIASAYCDERGARGSMGIPVPAGATAITGLRVVGEANGTITIELFRTGWNTARNKGEHQKLLTEVVQGAGSFHRHIQVRDSALNAEWDAVALTVEAQGKAEIWLVAAQFE